VETSNGETSAKNKVQDPLGSSPSKLLKKAVRGSVFRAVKGLTFRPSGA
jgi:hypothetical protein